MKETGLALFGEVGTEGRINPDGSFELTPDKPTIGMVKAGTEFISNKDLKAMIGKPQKVNYVGAERIDMKEVISAIKQGSIETKKAVKEIPVNQTIITKSGWRNVQKQNNGWSEYIKRNFN